MSTPQAAPSSESQPVLEVRDLTVQYRGEGAAAATVVEGASLALVAGETLGVLGESGSGKTTLALALLGLLPAGGRVTRGEVWLDGRDLLRMSEKELAGVRGDDVSMVFQEPGISLSPCLRAGDQVADVVRAHRRWSRRRCREHALGLLEQVRLEAPAEIYGAYPHQLSGGQKQRVVIAQALACQPRVMVADEPTAALDATTQARIVALLQELKERLELAVVFISHDAALLAEIADRVLIMYAGEIVEEGNREQVLRDPLHPYARELLRCAPRPPAASSAGGTAPPPRVPMPVIPGAAPDPTRWPPGCRFEPRCACRMAECCERRPAILPSAESRSVRCLRYEH